MSRWTNINEYFEDIPLTQSFDFYYDTIHSHLTFFTTKGTMLTSPEGTMFQVSSEPIHLFSGQTKEHSIAKLREHIQEAFMQPLELRLTDSRAWVRELK